jgi:hypothetical protein
MTKIVRLVTKFLKRKGKEIRPSMNKNNSISSLHKVPENKVLYESIMKPEISNQMY